LEVGSPSPKSEETFSTTKGIFEKAETKAKAMAMAKENLFND
jgi:hypothetical protein